MEIYDKLIRDGYYIGSSYDIFTEEELIGLEQDIKSDLNLGFDSLNKQGVYKWMYRLTSSCSPDLSISDPIPYNQIEKTIKYLESMGSDIDQQWYFTNFCDLQKTPIDIVLAKQKISKYIQKIYNINEELQIEPLNVTFYKKGDFTNIHTDGFNQGRICAVLIYLCDPNNYTKDHGGRIFVQPRGHNFHNKKNTIDDMEVCIEPVRPYYLILDFTQNNLFHAVEICKQEFNRYALICFPTIIKT